MTKIICLQTINRHGINITVYLEARCQGLWQEKKTDLYETFLWFNVLPNE